MTKKLTREKWVDIRGEEGRYMVSNMGKIFSKLSNKELKQCRDRGRKRYFMIWLSGKTYTVHRIVANHFCDKKDSTKINVNHIDGNKANNRADNLEWVTAKENIAHAKLNNLKMDVGEDNGSSKLKTADVREIMARHKKGERSLDLAREYNVSPTTVSAIIKGYSWTHVTEIKGADRTTNRINSLANLANRHYEDACRVSDELQEYANRHGRKLKTFKKCVHLKRSVSYE